MYIVERLRKYKYDRMALIKELGNNRKKWNVSFEEYNVKDTISKGDIVKVELFIQYVRKDLKIDMNSELNATQPLPNSPHIEAVVKVVKQINSDSLLVKSSILDSEILVEFENEVIYKKNDVVFLEGELSIKFL
ncbi:hypothetical protein [Leptotrichia wadei]|uniref:hypothetical protein n=1 Tax=Leptotrichia wadei TaxID=157687 RepID=UPI0028D0F3A2|nr:hypothetical protein [Leptotrichia wadei]